MAQQHGDEWQLHGPPQQQQQFAVSPKCTHPSALELMLFVMLCAQDSSDYRLLVLT